MAVPGYLAAVKLTGDATAFTSEPCTDSGDHQTYYVTDATKRILDTLTAVVVERDVDGGAPSFLDVPAGEIESINPLNSTVRFVAAQPAAAVIRLKSGKYLPNRALATAKSFKAALSRTILDSTPLGLTAGTAAKQKTAGLKDASGDLGLLEQLLEDYDSVKALAQTLWALIDGGTVTVLEIGLGASWKFRAFVLLESGGVSGDVDALVESTLAWSATARGITGRADIWAFSLSQW